jgi:hypothetical protein
VNVVFIFGASWLFFKGLDALIGMRVSREAALEGLDVPEMGGHGYPEIQGPGTLVHGAATTAFTPAATAVLATERGR